MPGLLPRGLALGSSLFLGGCIDQANYAALGFCVGVLATSGVMVAFMEHWVQRFSTLNRTEPLELLELDQVDAELVELEQPETRR